MKKHLLGLFAIAMAITLSSFGINQKETKTETAFQAYGFWYHSDGLVVKEPIYENGAAAIQKTNSIITSETDCPDDSGPVCVVGSATAMTFNQTLPGSLPAAARILRD